MQYIQLFYELKTCSFWPPYAVNTFVLEFYQLLEYSLSVVDESNIVAVFVGESCRQVSQGGIWSVKAEQRLYSVLLPPL